MAKYHHYLFPHTDFDAMYNAEVLALRNWLTARFAWLNTAIMDL